MFTLKLSDDNLAICIYSSTIWLAAKNMPHCVRRGGKRLRVYAFADATRHAHTRAKCLQPLEHAVDVIRRNFRRIHPLMQ